MKEAITLIVARMEMSREMQRDGTEMKKILHRTVCLCG